MAASHWDRLPTDVQARIVDDADAARQRDRAALVEAAQCDLETDGRLPRRYARCPVHVDNILEAVEMLRGLFETTKTIRPDAHVCNVKAMLKLRLTRHHIYMGATMIALHMAGYRVLVKSWEKEYGLCNITKRSLHNAVDDARVAYGRDPIYENSKAYKQKYRRRA